MSHRLILLFISSIFVYGIAPSFIKLLVPSEFKLVIFPGTAYTSFPCSNAKSAVIKLPLFFFASTTITPVDIPLIILFLFGKCNLSGFEPNSYSVIINPFLYIISFAKFIFLDGYITFIPEPNTAIVLPFAPICACVSIPIANPLIVFILFLANSFASFLAIVFPYNEQFLVPTIAIDFSFSLFIFPNAYSNIGES